VQTYPTKERDLEKMILLEIESNWYFFLVFAGGFAALSAVVLFFESRSDDDEILKTKPHLVAGNILLNQIAFYLVYLLVTFSIDITVREIFRVTQVFTSLEFSFNTFRGLFTGLCLIVAMGATSIAYTAVVRSYKNMLDYCFTVFVFHFIIVSIVQREFPASGAWWTASAIGLLASLILSERLSYHLETMSYQSHLQEPDTGEKTKPDSKFVDLPTLDSNQNSPRRAEVPVDELPTVHSEVSSEATSSRNSADKKEDLGKGKEQELETFQKGQQALSSPLKRVPTENSDKSEESARSQSLLVKKEKVDPTRSPSKQKSQKDRSESSSPLVIPKDETNKDKDQNGVHGSNPKVGSSSEIKKTSSKKEKNSPSPKPERKSSDEHSDSSQSSS